MTAVGTLRTFGVRVGVQGSVAAQGCPGGARRSTEAAFAALRLPCGARVHGPAHNSLRSLRSLRSDRMRQVSSRGSLRSRAMNPALLGASHARRAPPGQPFAGSSGGAPSNATFVPERQAVPGGVAVCGAEQVSTDTNGPLDRLCLANGRASWPGAACKASLEGGERSELRELTCRILSERSERSERSELCGTPSRRAAQGSRRAAPTATVGDATGHRLTRSPQQLARRKPTHSDVRTGSKADGSTPFRGHPRNDIPRSEH